MSVCTIDGCDKPAKGRGWCRMHWTRWRRHGSPHVVLSAQPGNRRTDRICDETGCGRKHYARGWCRKHYVRWQREEEAARPDPLSAEVLAPTACVGCGGRPMPGTFRCLGCFHRWKADKDGPKWGTYQGDQRGAGHEAVRPGRLAA